MKSQYSDKKLKSSFIITFAFLVLFAAPVSAQTLTENSPLTFGQIAMTDNNSAHQIILLTNGSFTADPAYIFFTTPQLGSYTINGQAPNTDLTINISPNPIRALGGGGPEFTLIDTFTRPAIVRTDATGDVTFEIGGTLVSNGSGGAYLDDRHEGDFLVSVTP